MTRNAPPVMIMSEPEPVQTIETTLLVVGANSTSPGFESSLGASISGILGVDPRRVAITGATTTWAALVENGVPDNAGGARRLRESGRVLSILEPALEVDFQVSMPADTPGVSATSSEVEDMVAAISHMKADPTRLVAELSEILPIDNLRVRLTTPFVRQKQAVFVAEEWGACARGQPCVAALVALRYRQVWCADSDNLSISLLPELCSGSMPRTQEPCPSQMSPPSCGWIVGSWSPCLSEPPAGPVTANMTEICNATGIGKQYRAVTCLSSGTVPEAEECKLPQPPPDRSCRCISSQVTVFGQLDLGTGESNVEVASASVMLVAVFAACVLCTCVSFGCFALTSRKSTDIKKADKLAEFDSYVVTGKEKQYKQRVSPATSVSLSRDITVCVADARQGGREDAVDDPDTASTDVGASPVPSASSPGSRVSQMAPLASPCSVASVASQPARMSPLPSPSTLSISSITAVLQSPAHANGPSEPNDTVFLPQSSPCLGSPSRSPKRRPTLPSVSETETHSTEAVLDHPHAPEEDAQPQVQPSARPRRKKNAPRPPTLQMDLCGPEEEEDAVPFASPSKRSPQKSREPPAERSDFSPAWLQPRGEVSFHNKAGTPAHAVRSELGSDHQEPAGLALPPQPRLPRPPAPDSPGPIPPPPLENKPSPPQQPPEGFHRGRAGLRFPPVPPSPSSNSKPKTLEDMPKPLLLPSAPVLPPPPPPPPPPFRHGRK